MRVFDLHCDTIDSLAFASYGAFSDYVQGAARGGDLAHNAIQLAADRMGCPWCQCYAVWVPDDLTPFGMNALTFYRAARDWFMAHTTPEGPVVQVCDARDVEGVLEAGNVAALLTIENGLPLDRLELVDEIASDGVKMVTLTWNAANPIASGSQAQGGLTTYGREALRALEDRRIVVDVSHLNDESFWDVARAARRPFAASHSNSRAVCGHPRNLTDDQFRAIAERGGIVGLNYHQGFVHESGEKYDFDQLIAHVEHWLELGGEDVIALAADRAGSTIPAWLADCSAQKDLFDQVKQRLGETITRKLFVENALRFLQAYEA